MSKTPGKTPPSFSAFTSAADEAHEWPVSCDRDQDRTWRKDAVDVDPTHDLALVKRKVEAQEQILRALIGFLADADPEVILQLKARIVQNRADRANEAPLDSESHEDEVIKLVEREFKRRHSL
ncbi:MAG: hypothetical protein ACOVS5_12665 [Oligoflexus sp.]